MPYTLVATNKSILNHLVPLDDICFAYFFVHLDSGVGLEKEHPLLAHWRRFVVTSCCPDWPNGRRCLFACFFLPWTGLVFCIMTAASDLLEMVLSSIVPWVI